MKKCILIVDDDKAITSQHGLYLRSAGFETVEANSVIRALECLEELDIHGIVTDIKMEPQDGFSLIRSVREQNINVPILCISSAGEKALEEAIAIGANLSFSKPVAPMVLTNALEKILQNTQEMDRTVTCEVEEASEDQI